MTPPLTTDAEEANHMESSTITRSQTFIHKCPNQQLFVRKPDYLRDSRGDRIGEDPGKIIHFEDNVYTATEAEAKRLEFYMRDEETGEVINPENPQGDFDALVAWLRSHEMFNATMFADTMPEEQEPTISAQTRRIMDLTNRFDSEGLRLLIEEERQTHDRPPVIQMANAGLESIRDGDNAA